MNTENISTQNLPLNCLPAGNLSNNALRHLTLNAMLSGHKFLDTSQAYLTHMDAMSVRGAYRATDSTTDRSDEALLIAAEALEATPEKIKDTAKALDSLLLVKPARGIYESLFLNFFRSNDYGFVLGGTTPCSVRMLAEIEYSGELKPAARDALLCGVISEVYVCDKRDPPAMQDGKLFGSIEDSDVLLSALRDAFKLLAYGPSELTKFVHNKLLTYTSLDRYKPLSAKDFWVIIDLFTKKNIHPRSCNETFLEVPDLLETYKACGLIMAWKDPTYSSVKWLVPVVQKPADTDEGATQGNLTDIAVHRALEEVLQLGDNSLRKLQAVTYQQGKLVLNEPANKSASHEKLAV